MMLNILENGLRFQLDWLSKSRAPLAVKQRDGFSVFILLLTRVTPNTSPKVLLSNNAIYMTRRFSSL